MLLQILDLLLDAAASFLGIAFLARFALQWARAPFRNPIGQFLIAVTDWAVRPARRVIPSAFGYDLASLMLAWLVQGLRLGLVYGLTAGGHASLTALGPIAALAVVEVAKLGCHLAFGVLLVSIILSWVNPYAPMAPLFDALAAPMLRPFRRIVPPLGGVDLSPLGAFLVIQVLLIVLGYAQAALTRALYMPAMMPF
jgi:YggT family protein